MERNECAFGQDILRGLPIVITRCRTACEDDCPYRVRPIG